MISCFFSLQLKKGGAAATPEGENKRARFPAGRNHSCVSRLCYYAHILASAEGNGKGGNQNGEKGQGEGVKGEEIKTSSSAAFPSLLPFHLYPFPFFPT
jgi:hypothetical protein